MLSAETIAAYEPEITSKVIELNTQHLSLAERETYGTAFLQVTNLWEHSEVVREFVFSQRLVRIATSCSVSTASGLYHDQALYKESAAASRRGMPTSTTGRSRTLDADITVAEPVNESQRNDLKGWMPGTAVGETPDSRLNPVLCRRGA